MTSFSGAPASNAGDDFHELWVARRAISLLSNKDGLEAIAVEGVSPEDRTSSSPEVRAGIDCTLYFGGRNARDAERVEVVQLKYSTTQPRTKWTVARLTYPQKRRPRSVFFKLAKAWAALASDRPSDRATLATLVTNQPVSDDLLAAIRRAAAEKVVVPRRAPAADATPETQLAYASGLSAAKFHEFAKALSIESGAGSRLAFEERVLQEIADWSDDDAGSVKDSLLRFVRAKAMPDVGEPITRVSVLVVFGVTDSSGLFPSPSAIEATPSPVSRSGVRDALVRIQSGQQYTCLHGRAGVGKTTALQEIESGLPPDSIMVTYDCYGAGSYLDAGALRHRSADAFVQLANELAVRLNLPMLLSRRDGSDYPRLFKSRLERASSALAARNPQAVALVAVDAADNAVTAARHRDEASLSFVREFVQLKDLPANVRLVVTTRTGRIDDLQLPRSYTRTEVEAFTFGETADYIQRVWPQATQSHVEDFYRLSGGVPRVLAYAAKSDDKSISAALDKLRPQGKSLEDIFEQSFDEALKKSAMDVELKRLLAALISLPRPVPLNHLASVLDTNQLQVADLCADLAPGIRVNGEVVGFADEDYEEFARAKGQEELANVRQRTAQRLLSCAGNDAYAAVGVAALLVDAGRGEDLLSLVEADPLPQAVQDPIVRNEVGAQRLRLAIKVCRSAGDAARALRFVLIGADGVKTEAAMHDLLTNNPDLAVRFASSTVQRMIFSDPDSAGDHGAFLCQRMGVDADRKDAFSVREGQRALGAWFEARKDVRQQQRVHRPGTWEISVADIAATLEATWKLDGPLATIGELERWEPHTVWLDVGLSLLRRLIAQGRGSEVETLAEDDIGPVVYLVLSVTLALAGRPVDAGRMIHGLGRIAPRRLRLAKFFAAPVRESSRHRRLLDLVLSACAILTAKGVGAELVDRVLEEFLQVDLRRIDRLHTHDGLKIDLILRAYTLREARAGRVPTAEGAFAPRPVDEESNVRRGREDSGKRQDRSLLDMVAPLFGVYVTTAGALAHRCSDAQLADELDNARARLRNDWWRVPYGGEALRRLAAKQLDVLLACSYGPEVVKRGATEIHGSWTTGDSVPDSSLVGSLSLREELHESLLKDLADTADASRRKRIAAKEKCDALVECSRLMAPLSEQDAAVVFGQAIEAAGELDESVFPRIRMLGELVARGQGAFESPRQTAGELSDVVADAAIRMSGYDHFPWSEAMSSLTRLDASLALANAARWDDAEVASLRGDTLAPLVETAWAYGSLRPGQVAALTVFVNDAGELMADLACRASPAMSSVQAFVEEAARDVLVAGGQHRNLADHVEQNAITGRWSDALRRQEQFLSGLPSSTLRATDAREDPKSESDLLNGHFWDAVVLKDSSMLGDRLRELLETVDRLEGYRLFGDALKSARDAVVPRDRRAHLDALTGLIIPRFEDELVGGLLEAIDAWQRGPAVRRWCRDSLPAVIVDRFAVMTRYIMGADNRLTRALSFTGLSDIERAEIMLDGIKRHVDVLGSERILRLAAMVGRTLPRADAASIVDWYVGRIADGLPPEHRDDDAYSDTPTSVDKAMARFLFAYMGDCDVRNRWRAAHGARRLARLGDETTLRALVETYGRREDRGFRAGGVPFYWLGANLWFALAWDRIAFEKPRIARVAGRRLFSVATDETFPHLVLRSIAQDACIKLMSLGELALTSAERDRLKLVNESPFPMVPVTLTEQVGRLGFGDGGSRFRFDETDTLRYWYDPVCRSFASLEGRRFLEEAERWIVEVWSHEENDVRSEGGREIRERLDRNWQLTTNGHGSRPTMEQFSTHLEWHAMWCAAGQFLKTEPLADGSYYTARLKAEIVGEKPTGPPLWSADLRGPWPLQSRYWRAEAPASSRVEWIEGVSEAAFRAEIYPSDAMDYLLVAGATRRRSSDRREKASVSSALVAPAGSRSLLRALQTMDDCWDYRLPDQGDSDFEIDDPRFRLVGWLSWRETESGVEEKDPFRSDPLGVATSPGPLVANTCGLQRAADGQPSWSTEGSEQPMFEYQTWGEPERSDRALLSAGGRRLLAHRGQLLDFLRAAELDLIVEVEVTRSGREDRRYVGEDNEEPEGRYFRLYLLDGRGNLEIAEGRLGPWADDRGAP